MVEVTEADRKAAISYLQGKGPWKAGEIGFLPDDDYLVQAFATHRIEAAKSGRDAGIIEGLEMADQKLKVLMLGLPVNGLKAQALLAASAAIHALIGEKI